MPQSTAIPRRVIRRSLDHGTAGSYRHLVGKDSVRRVHRLQYVHLRKVAERFPPIHRRQMLCKIERLRFTNQILLRCVQREHRSHLVLLPIYPRDQEHLDGTAAIPIPLFVIWSHAPHAGPEALRDHGRVVFISKRGDSQLPSRRQGASDGAHLRIGPGLLADPGECFISIREWWPKDVVVPFREEMSALVHFYVSI